MRLSPSTTFVTRPSSRAVYFYTKEAAVSASSILLYFILEDVLTEDAPFEI